MLSNVQLPPGTCDCHVHVVGPADQYPMVVDRQYTPGPASVQALRAHMLLNGLTRAVIVQASFYGSDNSCLLESLRELNGAGRGVAVVDDDVSEDALRALAAQGVRGLRMNLESSGVLQPKTIGKTVAHWAERVAFLNWHIQVYASLDVLALAMPDLQCLPVPIVLDHFAMVPVATSSADERIAAIISLVRAGRAYIKLSAPYRIKGKSEEDSAGFAIWLAGKYLEANPDQVLWGSDWPHTNREPGKVAHDVSAYRSIFPATLMQGIAAWLPTRDLLELVLVKNPARLYGF